MITEKIQAATPGLAKPSPLWLCSWLAVAVVLIPVAFLIPYYWWVALVAVSFAPMEARGCLDSHDGKYPPLTDVIRAFLPWWAAIPAMCALCFSAMGAWTGEGMHAALPMGLVGALIGFIIPHFIMRYASPAGPK